MTPAVRQIVLAGVPAPAYTFIAGGQSNKSGRGEIDTSATPPHPLVTMLGNDYVIKRAVEPVDINTNQIDTVSSDVGAGHSSDLKMASDIATATGKTVRLVPCAIGSTGIDGTGGYTLNWSVNLATRDDRSSLYGSMVHRAALSRGAKCVVWFGHEANASDNARWPFYWEHLTRRLREDIAANCPILYAQLAKHQTGSINTDQNKEADWQRRQDSAYSAVAMVVGSEVLTNTDLRVWSSGAPTGWTIISPGAGSTVTQDPLGARITTDGSTAVGIQASGLTNGVTYAFEVEISKYDPTKQGLKFLAAAQIVILGNSAVYRGVFTATGTTFLISRSTSGQASDVVVRSASVKPYTSGDVVRPISGTHMAVTYDLPLVDVIHLNGVGQRELGRRFALLYRERVLGEAVDGTGPRIVSLAHPGGDKSKVKITYTQAINTTNNKFDSQFRVYDGVTEMTVSTAVRDPGDDHAALITMSATATGSVTVSCGDVAASGAGVWLTQVPQNANGLPAPQHSALAVT